MLSSMQANMSTIRRRDFGAKSLSLLPCCLRLAYRPLPLYPQNSLQVPWLTACLMGFPPIGLFALSWTHYLTPFSPIGQLFTSSCLSPATQRLLTWMTTAQVVRRVYKTFRLSLWKISRTWPLLFSRQMSFRNFQKSLHKEPMALSTVTSLRHRSFIYQSTREK